MTVFSTLYDSMSLMFSRRWPTAEAVVTAVDLSHGKGLHIVIVYEFSLGNDGPYTGASRSPWWFEGTDVTNIDKRFAVGQAVTIRYRPDNPSVNKIDVGVWDDLQNGL